MDDYGDVGSLREEANDLYNWFISDFALTMGKYMSQLHLQINWNLEIIVDSKLTCNNQCQSDAAVQRQAK